MSTPISVPALLVCGVFCLSPASPVFGQATDGPEASGVLTGTWEGTLQIPTGAEVRVIFRITPKDEGWIATWDSPDQGAVGLPAGAPVLEARTLLIPLPVIQGRYEGTLAPTGTEVDGTFHQGPAEIALVLRRTSANAGLPERPQEPTAPFPYQAVDVQYENPRADDVLLAATLTIPDGQGPFPAAILISGSGPQDRNESLAGHKPFLVLADHLTRQGIAVLRFDDRGVGASTGTFGLATSADFATDVLAGVEYLKTRPEVRAGQIGLIGHSEGGLIAPLVANETEDVAYVVMMAGPGLPGDQILLLQSVLIARANGAIEAGIALNDRTQRELFRTLKGTDDPSTVREEVRATLERSIEEIEAIDAAAAEAQRQQVSAQVVQLTSPWFHYFLTHDPREPLRRLQQPVLAINGGKDLQVPAGPNLEAIDEALTEAANKDFTLHEFEGLNHLFQSAGTGAPSEYAELTETLSPRVLQVISGWIRERTVR